MHFTFLAYGMKEKVDKLFSEMIAQKHILTCNKGKEVKKVYIQSQLRLLPFGIYEYIFPKEDLNLVLNSLIVEENRYNIPKTFLFAIRKFLRLKQIPKYKKENKFLWLKEDVNIIPLGIREDLDLVEPDGFSHEAI